MDALLFIPIAILIALGPGPNNFCALHNGVQFGVKAAFIATTGRAIAYAIFLTLSALGIGAMLLASETAFTIVKFIGALYLLYLGIQTWRSRTSDTLEQMQKEVGKNSLPSYPRMRHLIAQEFLVGITNPKAILLFAAIFPQFINMNQPAPHQFFVLGSIYLCAEYVSSIVYAFGGKQIKRFISTSKGEKRMNRCVGTFFIGAGALLLSLHR